MINREIKFRIWNDVTRKWGYLELNKNDNTVGVDFITVSNYPNQISYQQFTGLKDKTGREIYEGDIIRYKYIEDTDRQDRDSEIEETLVIEFKNGKFGYEKWSNINDIPIYLDHWRCLEFKVIGNICENPELIIK